MLHPTLSVEQYRDLVAEALRVIVGQTALKLLTLDAMCAEGLPMQTQRYECENECRRMALRPQAFYPHELWLVPRRHFPDLVAAGYPMLYVPVITWPLAEA